MVLRFGRWTFTVDRQATMEAYAKETAGGADTCECAGCRNFRIARPGVFPREFLKFLDELGVDFKKDGEVYDVCRLENELHPYGGWYHFVGRLNETGDFPQVDYGPNFQAWLQRASAPALASLAGMDLVEIGFQASNVPWLLDEPDSG